MENIGNFRSFRKSNNEQIHIPRKLTGGPGCVRTVGTDSNTHHRIEAALEGGNNKIKWRVNVNIAIEPSDGARQMYCRVDGFRVSDALNHPTHTARIGCVPIPAG